MKTKMGRMTREGGVCIEKVSPKKRNHISISFVYCTTLQFFIFTELIIRFSYKGRINSAFVCNYNFLNQNLLFFFCQKKKEDKEEHVSNEIFFINVLIHRTNPYIDIEKKKNNIIIPRTEYPPDHCT
jgi:hypothetical protein